MDDATPIVAARLNARSVKSASSTLIALLIAVVITSVVSLASAIQGNSAFFGSTPVSSSSAEAEILEAHLMGRLTFQAVVSVLIGLCGWLVLYFSVVRRHDRSRGSSHMAILVAAALIAGVAVPFAAFKVAHPAARAVQGPVKAANRLNDDYEFAVSRSLAIYNANLANSRWVDLTWGGAIGERTDFEEVRRTLEFASGLSERALAEFEAMASSHEAQLQTLLAEQRTRDDVAGAVIAQSRKVDDGHRKKIQLDNEQIKAFAVLVGVLESSPGKWSVDGGRYAFNDAATKSAFERALENFVAVAKAREALNAPQG